MVLPGGPPRRKETAPLPRPPGRTAARPRRGPARGRAPRRRAAPPRPAPPPRRGRRKGGETSR
ncbi:MAG: hypothetical protein CW345_10375 [Firmicutes bacterium]|nr:hypothetical protein [Bacillota bacterium]MBO2522184.1 hypothetical protein [Bacillota bacterium]